MKTLDEFAALNGGEAYILVIPVELRHPAHHLIELSKTLTTDNGLDADWEPKGLHEAIYEILLYGGEINDPNSNNFYGVVPRLDLIDKENSYFSIRIGFCLNEPRHKILKEGLEIADPAWPRTFDSAMLAIFMAQIPPIDFGVQIYELQDILPKSNHEAIALEKRIMRSHDLGNEGKTIS